MSPAWMPLYIADYRAGTAHLNAAEHGAYLLLIMHYWQKGGLPTDDRLLSRIACMTPDEWQQARPLIAEFFTPEWRHARIDAELQKAAEISEKAREKANKRWSSMPQHSRSNATASAQHASSMPSGICHSPSKEVREVRADANASATRARDPDEFDVWWEAYPHKVGKGAARKAFITSRRKASLETLVEGVARYRSDKPPDRQWCNPATWLNEERWNDQPAIVTPSPRGQHEAPRRNLVDAGRDRVAFLRQQEMLAEQGGGSGDVVVQFLPESRLR